MNTGTGALYSHYASLDAESLEQIALYEATHLEPPAADALLKALDDRRMPEFKVSVNALREGIVKKDLRSLFTWFRNSPCPQCGRRNGPINACRLGFGKGLFVFLRYELTLQVGCTACLEERLAQARRSTRFRWVTNLLNVGSAKATVLNRVAAEKLTSPEPSDDLLEYFIRHLGPIAVARHADRDVGELIIPGLSCWSAPTVREDHLLGAILVPGFSAWSEDTPPPAVSEMLRALLEESD